MIVYKRHNFTHHTSHIDEGVWKLIVIKMLFAAIFLCVTFVSYCKSSTEPQACSTLINGCGAFVEDNGESNECCLCKERYGQDCNLPLLIFCDDPVQTGQTPLCCPCTTSASLSESCGTSLEECADPKDRRRVFRLLRKADRISKRTIRRCPSPVTDECAGKRTLRRLECIYDEIHELVEDIKEDCFGH